MIPVQAEASPGLIGHRFKQQVEMIGQIIRQVSAEDHRGLGATHASYVHPPTVAATGALAPWQERRAREIMRARLATRLSIADVARECRLTPSYFAKAFRRTTGMSPQQYLTDLRVREAKGLLLSSTLPLADIAIICGFGDQSYFTRVFTRSVGTSPGGWRRAMAQRPSVSPARENMPVTIGRLARSAS
jgi:AraC-like DNA-binding protein